jgi:hypothetical protein
MFANCLRVQGSFSVDEQILLRIEGESHKHLTISVIEETATLHGSCLATGTLSRDWTSTPTYGSDFQMQATNNVTIECNAWSPSKQTAGMQQLQTPGSSPAEPLVMQSTDRRASSASSVATMDGEHYLMMRTEISSKYFVLPKAISRSIATTFAITFDETTSLVMERYGDFIVARAPLRVSNTTLYPLLVGLHETSNSRSRPVIEREVFENERFQPARCDLADIYGSACGCAAISCFLALFPLWLTEDAFAGAGEVRNQDTCCPLIPQDTAIERDKIRPKNGLTFLRRQATNGKTPGRSMFPSLALTNTAGRTAAISER